MIKNMTPLSMTEAMEYMKEDKDAESEIKKFVKRFVKLSPKEAKELRAKIEALDMIKVKPEHIGQIIDFLPEDSESVNKIFDDVSLDEDEAKKILETVQEFK